MAMRVSATIAAAGISVLLCGAAPLPASEFLTTVMQTNLAEIQMGQLAQTKGSEHVRDYGKMLVKDHQAAEKKAEAIAKTMGIAVPSGPDAKAQADYNKLSQLPDTEFNVQFTQAMIDGHKQAVDLFTAESTSTDTKLAKFASDTLPTLKHHLESAETLHKAATG